MSPPPSVERLRRAWQTQAGGAREQAAFALLLAALVGGAHVARLGAPWARALTATVLLAVCVLQISLFVSRRREAGSTRGTIRRIVTATDPALGARALRAHALVLRSESDDSVGSPELAALHFSRLLDRVSPDAVRRAASHYAQRYRGVAVALLSMASIAVVMGPSRVVEGLDVLAARYGRAPVPMSFLGYARLVAQPPSYTHEPEQSLVFGTAVELPKGTAILVHGVPLAPGHTLVLTDGSREEPFSDDGAGGIIARYVVRDTREGASALRVASRFGDVRIDDEESLAITVVPDLPPSVDVEGAPRTVRLVDADRIDVRWAARDDHGIREVDLVMRSGAREERRMLARFDGETKIERGGRVVTARDAYLRHTFLPVTVTVEVKDNDPLDGPKWGHSAAILVIPPEVGQPEAERLAGLRSVRDALVDLLVARSSVTATTVMTAKERSALEHDRLSSVENRVEEVLSATYAGSPMPRALAVFVRGQIDKLRRTPGDVPARAVESAFLGVDAAVSASGNHDAVDVAKRLGDVAEEAAVSARAARAVEHGAEAAARLDASLDAINRGAEHLETLASLGADVGGVAQGDAGRIRRARDARDFTHAELAALHLAERLRRPVPSFGATTGGGGHGGGGVESGHGKGGGDLPPPSSAEEDFERAANAVSELAEEHEGALRGVESALDAASRSEPTDAKRAEAKRLAEAVRRAAAPLPLPGQELETPRAAAALAREHANAAAHALDDLSLPEATESAESSLGALDQAEKKLDPGDPLRGELGPMRRALHDAMDFSARETEQRRAEAEARAGSTVREAGDTESGLAERAEKLGADTGDGEGALPHDVQERLSHASNVMREAARELAAGHGERGTELQREAQRLLDQARPEHAGEHGGDGSDGDDEGEPASRHSESDDAHGEGGHSIAMGGDVPGPDAKARAEEFRKRVLEGLGREKSERLSPAVQRYAEGLLR